MKWNWQQIVHDFWRIVFIVALHDAYICWVTRRMPTGWDVLIGFALYFALMTFYYVKWGQYK